MRQNPPNEYPQIRLKPWFIFPILFCLLDERGRRVDVFPPHIYNQVSRLGSKFLWVFQSTLTIPWSKLGRNQVLGKNGGNGFRCFCQDQYFSTMFIYELFNLLWHIQGGKERFVPSPDANWQFLGWRGKDQGPGETSGRERERLVLCVLCVSRASAAQNFSSCVSRLCLLFHDINRDLRNTYGECEDRKWKLNWDTLFYHHVD